MPAEEMRTIKGWTHYLQEEDKQLTLTEYMALCLLHIRENGLEAREAIQHLEGMAGAQDVFLRAVADQMALPYPDSATERGALHAQRRRQDPALPTA